MVDRVSYVGHDDTRPQGQQDVFMLDGSTLAYGTEQDDGHIDVTQTQSLPGVGPMDDGSSLVKLAVHQSSTSNNDWMWWLGGTIAVALGIGGTTTWLIRRNRGAHTSGSEERYGDEMTLESPCSEPGPRRDVGRNRSDCAGWPGISVLRPVLLLATQTLTIPPEQSRW